MRIGPVSFAGLFLICAFLSPLLTAQSKNVASDVLSRTYPDSADGLRAQFADIVEIVRSRDATSFHTELDSLAVPSAEKWFAAHFDARFASQLPTAYGDALTKYQSHVTWVMENFAKFDDFAVVVESLPPPAPLADSGFESLLPKPNGTVNVEAYRLSSASSDPKHGPPHWVSSFVHVDGRFRYVGGTYPFWAEGLTALRGPMSLPPTVLHGRTVQGIAEGKDQPGSGIDAVIQLKIDVDREGRVRHIKVLSGDRSYVEDAKEYIQQREFGALPDIPQLANAKREWEFEIAFFTPRK